jgi:tetratricopeptide (TPR) repeat protein
MENGEMASLEAEIERYRQEVSNNPNSFRSWVQLGKRLQQQANLPAAEEAYRQSLKIRNNTPLWIYKILIDILEEQEKISEAISTSEYLHEVYPQQQQEFYLKHQQLLQKQEPDLHKIKERLEKQILSEENIVLNGQVLAIIYEKLNQEALAIRSYRQVLKLQPENYQNYFAVGILLEKLGKFDAAKRKIAKANSLKKNIKDRQKKIKRFRKILVSRDFKQAIDWWLKISQKPQDFQLEQEIEKLCIPYQRNIGSILYDYYEKFGVEKIKPLLDINLDLIIFYISEASSTVKRKKFFSFVKNLHKMRFAAVNYQQNGGHFLEVIERVDDRLQLRQKIDGFRLQEAAQELKLVSQEFQNYFQDRPKLSYKKIEDLKVDLCISGQLRGYQEAFQTREKYILKPLQPDIFVITIICSIFCNF